MSKIRLCNITETKSIQSFIDDVWKKGHILSVNQKLLNFQYLQGNHYNFFMAEDNQKIIGLLGFIPLNLFDESLLANRDYWLALWKTDEKHAAPGVGVSLLKTLEKTFMPNSVGVLGINSDVKKIYEILGFKTGVMNHYYIANPKCEKFYIAENMQMKYDFQNGSSTFHEIRDISQIKELGNSYYPHKSKKYIENRYFKHPFYKYLFWGVYNKEELVAVFVMRQQKTNESQCLRIIDMIGNYKEINLKGSEFLSVMMQFEAEYIDCLNFGIPETSFLNWGFTKKEDNTLIPNLFEPFLKKNADLQFAYKTDYSEYVIFKGDGDQDRPNSL
jgi:hypothetical protein